MSLYKFQQTNKIKTKSYTLSDTQPDKQSNIQKTAENLLVHIPGEAAGFYSLAVAYLGKAVISFNEGIILFVLSLGLLLLVRILAKATIAVIATSVIAFVLWMSIIPNGAFLSIAPDYMNWKLIIAAFFTAVVTILANAGKLK